jgi:hypothetical protein
MRFFILITAACLSLTLPTASVAGGLGTALSKAGDDLITAFNKAADPSDAPRILKPQHNYNPPTPVPGGSTTYSNGYSGTVSPNLTTTPLSDIFNRVTGN